MRILAISDSHKNTFVIEKIILREPTAKHIFFLGDCAGDIEDLIYEFDDRCFHIVSGNCDFFSLYPSSGIEILDGRRIFYTHGHTLGVKHGLDNLINTARSNNCQLALYGHTHASQILYDEGIYIVNPGSCSQPRSGNASYAVIDVINDGIMPIIKEI